MTKANAWLLYMLSLIVIDCSLVFSRWSLF
jgi:hypothetical protein